MGTNDISDHYPIILNLENAVEPNSSSIVFSFTSREEMEVFKKSWIHFTYEPYPSRANVVGFYNCLWYSIETSFSSKRKKRLANPFYYTSNKMHTLNKLKTAKRKTVKNPSKTNIESVEKLQVGFSNSAEMDRMLFVAGASTNTLPDCFSLLNSLKTNTYPMVMSYDDDCLKTVPQISNDFNTYFSSNFNHTEIQLQFMNQMAHSNLMILFYP